MIRHCGLLLGGLLIAACASPATREPSSLAVGIDREARSCEPAAALSLIALRLDDGGEQIRRRSSRLIRPASTMKLLTVGTALHLGIEGRELRTRLLRGPTANTCVLVGAGDPLLSSKDLRELASHLPASPKITRVYVDGGIFAGPRFGEGWMWDDEPASFLPHLGGLSVDRDCVEVVASVKDGQLRVALRPPNRHLRLKNEATISSSPNARCRITRNWKEKGRTITVRGSLAPTATRRRRLSVPGPDLYAGEVLAEILRQAGHPVAEVQRGAATGGETLGVFARPAAALLPPILKDSDNLCAENLLRLISLWDGTQPGSAKKGLEVVSEYLRTLDVDPNSLRLADGSGVSHYNLITVEVLVKVLQDLHTHPNAQLFKDSLPIAGVDGTLSRRFLGTPLAGKLRAKTGTISGVSSLAGYLNHPEHGPIAFAMTVQNFAGSPRPWRALKDRVALLLAGVSAPSR